MQARLRRGLKFLPPVLGLLVLGGILVALHGAEQKLSIDDVLAALAATPRRQIIHAVVLLGVSFCWMMIYDIPGIIFAKRREDFPRIGLKRVALASFCAYALSHVVGAPALTAAAVRLRLYAQWGVPPAGIGRIVTVSGTMFVIGTCALLGGILVVHPADVPAFGHDVSAAALRGLGLLLWGAIAVYVALAHGETPIKIFRLNIPRPGFWVAVAQVALSCADSATACGILYAVLPTLPGLTFAHVLGIYLAGFAGGLLSGLPGGVGVFDSLLLLGLAGSMNTADAIGAILLFRVLYYLAPAALAGVAFAGHEVWVAAAAKRDLIRVSKINGSS